MPSQTLSLSQTQQLQMILAPQLRQSLEMLQLPILELRAMIQQEIEQNPTIEEAASDLGVSQIEPEKPAVDDKKELEFEKEFQALASLDAEWRDYFFQNTQATHYSEDDAERRQYMFDSLPQRESLQDHILEQLALSGLSEADRQIAELIIGSINEDGYLSTPMEELAASAGFDVRQVEDILTVIHDFHPSGIGARNLRECLLIQLEKMDKGDSLAATMVRDHIDALAAHKYNDICNTLKCGINEVQEAAKLIARLDPKPGRIFNEEVATYIEPEVAVEKVDGRYVVILNDDNLPHVRISRNYRDMLEREDTPAEVKSYIRDKIRAGAFLIKSIHQRQSTIRRVATEIVSRQTGFLDNGLSHLTPMTMTEVAQAVGVHETTVSRTVSSKYMRTPAGIFEMKFFFTPGIKMDDGSSLSNKTVKDMIANFVAAEDTSNPVSDQDILDHLKSKGVKIARRTITKYRLLLHIPPSHMRKI